MRLKTWDKKGSTPYHTGNNSAAEFCLHARKPHENTKILLDWKIINKNKSYEWNKIFIYTWITVTCPYTKPGGKMLVHINCITNKYTSYNLSHNQHDSYVWEFLNKICTCKSLQPSERLIPPTTIVSL